MCRRPSCGARSRGDEDRRRRSVGQAVPGLRSIASFGEKSLSVIWSVFVPRPSPTPDGVAEISRGLSPPRGGRYPRLAIMYRFDPGGVAEGGRESDMAPDQRKREQPNLAIGAQAVFLCDPSYDQSAHPIRHLSCGGVGRPYGRMIVRRSRGESCETPEAWTSSGRLLPPFCGPRCCYILRLDRSSRGLPTSQRRGGVSRPLFQFRLVSLCGRDNHV